MPSCRPHTTTNPGNPLPRRRPPSPVLLKETRDILSFSFGVWDVCFRLEKNKGKGPVITAQEARVRRERTTFRLEKLDGVGLGSHRIF